MPSGIDPRVDYAFKRLFGSENTTALLIDLLNAVLQLVVGKRVRDVILRNPFSAKTYAEDKTSILDVRASDESGRQHHLEMQRSVTWAFPKRFLFYWAQHYSGQMREGDYHETLCATFSIAFLDSVLFDDEHYHHVFRPWDHERGLLLCKDMELHTIELPRFNLTVEQLTTPLERWCYFLKHGDTLDSDKLPPALDVPPIRQAVEILTMLSKDELERERYLDRLKGQRDAQSLANAARFEREAGREEGRREEMLARIQLCQRALKQPVTPKEELLRLQGDDLARLAEQLDSQLLSNINGTVQPETGGTSDE
jgi:predicted transposase/invertase (TIGR01784 family)